MRVRILYWLTKIRYYLSGRNQEIMNAFYRKQGVKVGERCLLCTSPLTSESFLIEIGDDVVISTDVTFVTHDHSIMKVIPDGPNLFGKIVIGNNCFIGERSVLMYGVELAENIIVASGSVVTKSFPQSNVIIGGNPAKVIGTWESFREKNIGRAVSAKKIRDLVKTDPDVLIKRGNYVQK